MTAPLATLPSYNLTTADVAHLRGGRTWARVLPLVKAAVDLECQRAGIASRVVQS